MFTLTSLKDIETEGQQTFFKHVFKVLQYISYENEDIIEKRLTVTNKKSQCSGEKKQSWSAFWKAEALYFMPYQMVWQSSQGLCYCQSQNQLITLLFSILLPENWSTVHL